MKPRSTFLAMLAVCALWSARAVCAPLPAPDTSQIAELQQRAVMRLKFSPLEGAASYRIVVATDKDLREVVLDVVQRRPEARVVDLRDGEYFYGVRGIDALGGEGAVARGRIRLKARPLAPAAQAPAAGATLPPGRVAFAWLPAEETVRYRFQLAADTAFSRPLVDRGGLVARELALERLEAGRYYWRVASVRPDGDQGPFSDPQALLLQAPPPPQAQ